MCKQLVSGCVVPKMCSSKDVRLQYSQIKEDTVHSLFYSKELAFDNALNLAFDNSALKDILVTEKKITNIDTLKVWEVP